MRRRADSLAYADQNTRQANTDVRNRVRVDNMNAWHNVSVAPKAPLIPIDLCLQLCSKCLAEWVCMAASSALLLVL